MIMSAKRVVQVIKEMMTVGTGGFTSSGDPKTKAGFDLLVGFKNKKKKDTIDYRRVPKNYKQWVRNIKNMEK